MQTLVHEAPGARVGDTEHKIVSRAYKHGRLVAKNNGLDVAKQKKAGRANHHDAGQAWRLFFGEF